MEGSEVDRGPSLAVRDMHPNPRVMCRGRPDWVEKVDMI